jgi:hypothetical protein
MASYYVNMTAQQNGDHEVHRSDCVWLPGANNRIFLGEHSACHGAVTSARIYYPQSNGCYWCSNACHTS